MLVTCLLSVGLALVSGAAPNDASAAQPQARTLLLVQPLYPGQEVVAQRAEQSIGALLPQEQKAGQIIGREALAAWLEGRRIRTGCLLDKPECREPLDAWLQRLGVESVLLVKGGQDGSGFHFRAVRVRKAGERLEGEATDANFEKALTGALVKVYSLAATVEVVSTPPGATLFVDGVKLGTTPLSTQLLPGEHTFRFELASYAPGEVSRTVKALARMNVEHVLQKEQARLAITAEPKGTRILVDGQEVGRDMVEINTQPGPHVLRLEREGYEPFVKTVTLSSGEKLNLERTLELIPQPVQPAVAVQPQPQQQQQQSNPVQSAVAVQPQQQQQQSNPVQSAVMVQPQQQQQQPNPVQPAVMVQSQPEPAQQQAVAVQQKPVAAQQKPVTAQQKSEPAQQPPPVSRAEGAPLNIQKPTGSPLPKEPLPPPPAPKEEKEVQREGFFEITVQGVNPRGSQMVARPMGSSPLDQLSTVGLTQPEASRLRGFSFDFGSTREYFAWTILGASLTTAETPLDMDIQVPDAWKQNPPAAMQEFQQAGPPRFRTSIISLRLLHPEVHFKLWRFTAFLRVGAEGKLLLLEGTNDTYKRLFPDGLLGFDVHLTGQAGLRARLFGGVYATVAYQLSHSLREQVSGTAELKGGLGYEY